jgi:DNA invertase Pin-like site-specific DNA recombinase
MTVMTKRIVLYARVSTDGQTCDNQLHELRKIARRHKWKIVGEYVDHAVSGANGRDRRPEFDNLLKAAVRREFDVVAAWSVDRLGRSLQHLVGFLDELHAKGIDLYLHQQGIDTTTPAGNLIARRGFSPRSGFVQLRLQPDLGRLKQRSDSLGESSRSDHDLRPAAH